MMSPVRRGSRASQRPTEEGVGRGRGGAGCRRRLGVGSLQALLGGVRSEGSKPERLPEYGGGEGRGLEDAPGWSCLPCAFYWPDQPEA